MERAIGLHHLRHLRAARVFSMTMLFFVLGSGGSSAENFVQVAYLPEGLGGKAHLSGYDTDHDALEELLLADRYATIHLYEHIGSNQYQPVLTLDHHVPWALGDVDSDGLSDMVVGSHDSLEVFESPVSDSHPTDCVWQWGIPYPGNAPSTWITDLDRDGRREMLVSHMGRFIYIFENTADNTYTEVFRDSVWLPYGSISEISNGDFDLDGKTEFITSDSDGNVIVYENTMVGVDSFAITWTGNVPTRTAYAVAAANDMDQDGRPEFVIGGNHPAGGGRRHVFTVFESTGNDTYESVWMDSSLTSGLLDVNRLACGDVDGDSIDEMLFGVDESGIYLYKCNGPDSYERIWEWYTIYGIGAVLIYDLNRNGYGELVVSTPGGTWIFEKELTGTEELKSQLSMAKSQLLQNYPNPCGELTIINYQLSKPHHTSLRIYDLTGRLVRTLVDEPREAGYHEVSWDGMDDAGRRVPSGVYFYRLETGSFRKTCKMTVLR